MRQSLFLGVLTAMTVALAIDHWLMRKQESKMFMSLCSRAKKCETFELDRPHARWSDCSFYWMPINSQQADFINAQIRLNFDRTINPPHTDDECAAYWASMTSGLAQNAVVARIAPQDILN